MARATKRLSVVLLAAMMSAACGESELVQRTVELHSDFRPVPEQFQLRQALGSSGRGVLFLNFDGLTMRYGASSSKQNTSWIVPQGWSVRIPSFSAQHYGAARTQAIQTVVDMVKRDFANWDVVVTTERPSQGDYTMIVIGGSPSLIGEPNGTAGIAPLDIGNPNRNDVVFVFSETLNDLRELATCISHEAGHSFGLEHLQPTSAIMYPVVQPGTLSFQRARIYGRSNVQDQPGILSKLFGAAPGAGSNPTTPKPPVATTEDDAAFVSQEVPASLSPGETFIARLTFRNTGSTTWSGSTGYALMAPDSTWGGDTLMLSGTVAPGATKTFAFYAQAPTTPGQYTFRWTLTVDGAAFGKSSAPVNVTVKSSENQLPAGELEYADAELGRGWAWDPDTSSSAVWIDIYIDDEYAGSVKADQARNDLGAKGVVGANHGFVFGMPTFNGGTHRIEAYAVDDKGEHAYKLPGDFYVAP
ncbi:MAG: NBR1-Ig-like domain-containing protein [Myxococcaceae bacterium]